MKDLIVLAILGWLIVSDLLNRRERNRLMNRIMAKDYQEFEYYDRKFDKDLKEVSKLRSEERKLRSKAAEEEIVETDIETGEDIDAKSFVEGMEEDWRMADIDRTQVKQILEKEDRIEAE